MATPPTPALPPLGPDDLVLCAAPLSATPLFDRLAPAKAAGFAALSLTPVEVWALEAQGVTAAEIAARVADAGLRIAELDCTACWMDRHARVPATGDTEMAQLLRSLTAERVVETAARLGARSVAAIDMNDTPPTLDEAAEGFARLCDHAAQHGLLAHIEFLPVGGICTLAQAWAIVQAAGRENGGITLDAWHFFRSGSTLDQLWRIPGHRIHAIQLCDAPATPQPDLWTELMTARLLPGEGDIDLAGLVRTLSAIGCTAPVGVEVFHERQQHQTITTIARDWATSTRAVLCTAKEQA